MDEHELETVPLRLQQSRLRFCYFAACTRWPQAPSAAIFCQPATLMLLVVHVLLALGSYYSDDILALLALRPTDLILLRLRFQNCTMRVRPVHRPHTARLSTSLYF